MKKLAYCLILILILATVLFPIGTFANEEDTSNLNVVNMGSQGLMENKKLAELLGEDVVSQMQEQAVAVDAYNYLLEKLLTDKGGNIVYPDNYGGEYIEDGNLIISLVDASADDKDSYLKLLDKFKSKIKILDVEYSVNELNRIAEEVIGNMDDSVSAGFYIDPRNNQVVITVPEKSLDIQKDSFTSNNVTSDLPVVIEAQQELIPATKLYGGDPITNIAYGYTLGVCGTYSGNPAILTAGHDMAVGDDIVYVYNDEVMGTVAKKQFKNNGTGDYAIATITDSSYKTTNKVYSDSSSYQIKGKYSLPVGGIGYRYGAECMGIQALEVEALNKTAIYGGYSIKGMTITKHISGLYCIEGDSGGPYYAMNGSSQWCIVGTTAACGPTGSTQKVVINPISNVSGFTVKTN